mmetsp:Transcript_8150/g.23161  ORF Transcript_8150/g.23161 Transcript_8150/m.23161 type:complete len:225 (-) Transcript_8150:1453-2127(-)
MRTLGLRQRLPEKGGSACRAPSQPSTRRSSSRRSQPGRGLPGPAPQPTGPGPPGPAPRCSPGCDGSSPQRRTPAARTLDCRISGRGTQGTGAIARACQLSSSRSGSHAGRVVRRRRRRPLGRDLGHGPSDSGGTRHRRASPRHETKSETPRGAAACRGAVPPGRPWRCGALPRGPAALLESRRERQGSGGAGGAVEAGIRRTTPCPRNAPGHGPSRRGGQPPQR